jgi:hypothetical protein
MLQMKHGVWRHLRGLAFARGGDDEGGGDGGGAASPPARVCAREVVVMVMMVEVEGPGPRHLRLVFARGRWWAEVVGGGSGMMMGR